MKLSRGQINFVRRCRTLANVRQISVCLYKRLIKMFGVSTALFYLSKNGILRKIIIIIINDYLVKVPTAYLRI